jgi:hypothetical protein
MTIDWPLMIQTLRQNLDRFPSQTIKGEDFSVRIYARFGVRYSEGSREMTLMTEDVDASDRYGRTLFVLPRFETQVLVPKSLVWDNGERLGEEEATLALQRVCEAFKRRKARPRVVVRDETYQQIWEDIQQAEEPRP